MDFLVTPVGVAAVVVYGRIIATKIYNAVQSKWFPALDVNIEDYAPPTRTFPLPTSSQAPRSFSTSLLTALPFIILLLSLFLSGFGLMINHAAKSSRKASTRHSTRIVSHLPGQIVKHFSLREYILRQSALTIRVRTENTALQHDAVLMRLMKAGYPQPFAKGWKTILGYLRKAFGSLEENRETLRAFVSSGLSEIVSTSIYKRLLTGLSATLLVSPWHLEILYIGFKAFVECTTRVLLSPTASTITQMVARKRIAWIRQEVIFWSHVINNLTCYLPVSGVPHFFDSGNWVERILSKLLGPYRTTRMICGVQQMDIFGVPISRKYYGERAAKAMENVQSFISKFQTPPSKTQYQPPKPATPAFDRLFPGSSPPRSTVPKPQSSTSSDSSSPPLEPIVKSPTPTSRDKKEPVATPERTPSPIVPDTDVVSELLAEPSSTDVLPIPVQDSAPEVVVPPATPKADVSGSPTKEKPMVKLPSVTPEKDVSSSKKETPVAKPPSKTPDTDLFGSSTKEKPVVKLPSSQPESSALPSSSSPTAASGLSGSGSPHGHGTPYRTGQLKSEFVFNPAKFIPATEKFSFSGPPSTGMPPVQPTGQALPTFTLSPAPATTEIQAVPPTSQPPPALQSQPGSLFRDFTRSTMFTAPFPPPVPDPRVTNTAPEAGTSSRPNVPQRSLAVPSSRINRPPRVQAPPVGPVFPTAQTSAPPPPFTPRFPPGPFQSPLFQPSNLSAATPSFIPSSATPPVNFGPPLGDRPSPQFNQPQQPNLPPLRGPPSRLSQRQGSHPRLPAQASQAQGQNVPQPRPAPPITWDQDSIQGLLKRIGKQEQQSSPAKPTPAVSSSGNVGEATGAQAMAQKPDSEDIATIWDEAETARQIEVQESLEATESQSQDTAAQDEFVAEKKLGRRQRRANNRKARKEMGEEAAEVTASQPHRFASREEYAADRNQRKRAHQMLKKQQRSEQAVQTQPTESAAGDLAQGAETATHAAEESLEGSGSDSTDSDEGKLTERQESLPTHAPHEPVAGQELEPASSRADPNDPDVNPEKDDQAKSDDDQLRVEAEELRSQDDPLESTTHSEQRERPADYDSLFGSEPDGTREATTVEEGENLIDLGSEHEKSPGAAAGEEKEKSPEYDGHFGSGVEFDLEIPASEEKEKKAADNDSHTASKAEVDAEVTTGGGEEKSVGLESDAEAKPEDEAATESAAGEEKEKSADHDSLLGSEPEVNPDVAATEEEQIWAEYDSFLASEHEAKHEATAGGAVPEATTSGKIPEAAATEEHERGSDYDSIYGSGPEHTSDEEDPEAGADDEHPRFFVGGSGSEASIAEGENRPEDYDSLYGSEPEINPRIVTSEVQPEAAALREAVGDDEILGLVAGESSSEASASAGQGEDRPDDYDSLYGSEPRVEARLRAMIVKRQPEATSAGEDSRATTTGEGNLEASAGEDEKEKPSTDHDSLFGSEPEDNAFEKWAGEYKPEAAVAADAESTNLVAGEQDPEAESGATTGEEKERPDDHDSLFGSEPEVDPEAMSSEQMREAILRVEIPEAIGDKDISEAAAAVGEEKAGTTADESHREVTAGDKKEKERPDDYDPLFGSEPEENPEVTAGEEIGDEQLDIGDHDSLFGDDQLDIGDHDSLFGSEPAEEDPEAEQNPEVKADEAKERADDYDSLFGSESEENPEITAGEDIGDEQLDIGDHDSLFGSEPEVDPEAEQNPEVKAGEEKQRADDYDSLFGSEPEDNAFEKWAGEYKPDAAADATTDDAEGKQDQQS